MPLGRYTLQVGDPAGTEIQTGATQGDSGELRQAVEHSDKEERKRTAPELLEDATDEASQVTSKIERVTTLCAQVMAGEMDLKSVSGEIDALVGLLARLDRAGRWEEALRVVRRLSVLLALMARWIALLRSLRIALHAAEQLGDTNGKAWALHELGTLHLAADEHAEADDLLSRARELRKKSGDRRGLAMTERNLRVLCRTLRARLHRQERANAYERFLRRPVLVLGAAAMLLAAGGSAGAVIGHSEPSHHTDGNSGSPNTTDSTPSGGNQGSRTSKRSATKPKVANGSGETRTATHTAPAAVESQGQPSEVVIHCPELLSLGAPVHVSGAVTPPKANVTVHVAFLAPSGERRVDTETDEEGAYRASTKADEEGEWKAFGAWDGDSATAPATSHRCTFKVQAREPTGEEPATEGGA